MKTIGIVGSRRRRSIPDYKALESAFNEIYEDGDRIVSGGCPHGADSFAETIAEVREISITIHYARWKKHGKAAGFVRNTDVATDCDVLIALPAADRKGGTEDAIKKARKLGKKVVIVK